MEITKQIETILKYIPARDREVVEIELKILVVLAQREQLLKIK